MTLQIRNNLHYIAFLSVLVAGALFARGGFQRNLWSLRYLWGDLHGMSGLQINSEQLYSLYPRLRLWSAQESYLAGDIGAAQSRIMPLITENRFDEPNLRYDTLRLYAAILEESGFSDEALTLWREIRDIDSLHGVALKATNEGDLTKALQIYEIAYDLDARAGTTQLAKFVWQNLKEPYEAEAILQRALQDFLYSSERPVWLHNLAQIYREEEMYDAAIQVYEHLLDLNDKDFTAALRLAQTFNERGDGIAVVITQMQRAIAIDPTKGDSYFAIGQMLSRSGEFHTADHWFAQAVQKNPAQLSWQLSHAANARDLNDPQLTVARYKQLLEHLPDNHRAQAEAAWAFHLFGSSTDARNAIDAAIQLTGDQTPSLYLDRAEKIYAE